MEQQNTRLEMAGKIDSRWKPDYLIGPLAGDRIREFRIISEERIVECQKFQNKSFEEKQHRR